MPKKNVAEHDRANKALALRAQGATYEQIAERLDYSGRGAVHNAVHNLLKQRTAEGVDELRAQGQARYETVIREASLILSERKKSTEITDDGVTEKIEPVYDPAERMAAARAIIRAQDSLNRLFGLNVEAEHVGNSTQVLIVEAEVLSNNMAAALAPEMPQVELGEIIDVVVDDE